MRFSDPTTFYRAVDAKSSRVVTLKRRLTAWTRKQASTATILFAVAAVCSLCLLNNESFAQNASSNISGSNSKTSNNALSPEEASGVSLRDFDAIRAISPDYLKNPDGGTIPVDEDDLWTPELALGKKTPAQTAEQGMRIISYGEEKTTTEVRRYGAPVAQNIKAEVAQAQVASPSNSSSSQNAQTQNNEPKTVVPAVYNAAQKNGVPNPIRQTQSLEPAASNGEFDNHAPGGFSNYPVVELNDSKAGESIIYNSSAIQADESTPSFSDYQAPVENELPPANAFLNEPAFAEPSAFVSIQPTPQIQETNNLPSRISLNQTETYLDSDALQATIESNAEESEPFRETFTATNHASTSSDVSVESKPDSKELSLEAARLSENEQKNLIIEDIRISGLEMTTQQFNKIIKTRIGAKFNQQRLEEDKRALLQTKQFIDVAISTSWTPEKPEKVVVNFDLTPRRLMRYAKVVGNTKIAKHDILEELGIKPGISRMDPYEVENGRLRIIELYKSKDYAEPYVEILRGDRPEDIGVVYLIDEGVNQRVLKTSFTGNTVVSAARLRSLITVKPGFLYFLGGKFTRDRLDADVEKLLEYYRQLGYFDARIDREYQESSGFAGLGKDNAWVAVRYIIDEGPRYKIRNFTFSGNRVLDDKILEEKLKVKPGSYYYFNEVEADRVALRCKYQDLGYVRADITPNLIFTDEVGVVDVRYDIEEDHRYRVRDVIVDYVGTESRTMTPVVLNMLDLTPGELLNGVKIRQSENTLRLSGYFNDKPSEGQLPEIAVIPDDSKVYVTEKRGKKQTLKEARRPVDEEESASEKENGSSRTTRGQALETKAQYAAYVPYEQVKQAKIAEAPQNDDLTKKAEFRSYGPSVARGSAPKMAAASKVYISPVRPFDSIIRAQTTIPSGFSSVTTRANSNASSGYTPYDPNARQDSQYSIGQEYANYQDEYQNDSYEEHNSAPGFSSGVYDSISENAVEPISPDNDDVYDGDVLIKLQEGRTGMFTASIGVNSDYGLVGNVSFTERNFNLFRPPTNMFTCDGWKDAFRGGGQIFNVQASPGTNVQSYRVSWDVPYVFHTKNTFGITGLYGDHSFDEWFESRYGGEIRLGRQWTPRFSTTLSGGIYGVKISEPLVSFVPDLNDALGTNAEYTLGLSAAYDTRNHPYQPSEGYLVKGAVEQVLGDYQFPRASLGGRYYKTLHKRIDGSGRWILGLSSNFAWNGSDAPIYERYYGGGSSNLRGFEYRGVTPRYGLTGFGVGGNFEFYNTAELLIPVSGGDEFQFALFVDSGTVAKDIKNWGRYRVAPGLGLRFSIPMLGPAPLALDFAFPVSKDPDDITEVFSFSMSGSR